MLPWIRSAGTLLLDWVYPEKCALCSLIGRKPLCDECLQEMRPLPNAWRPGKGALDWIHSLYDFDGRAAQAVKKLKYARSTSLAAPMSALMAAALPALPESDLIVPVPIHRSRYWARGFNQSELLSEAMPEGLVVSALMVRTKRTRPQVELDAKQRLTNLRGAFTASNEVKGRTVLLIDDVVTTGGTGIACAEALKAAGADKVGLLAFCGSDPGPVVPRGHEPDWR